LAQTPPPPMRVAVINIGLVFSKYDKARVHNQQLQKLLEPYQLDGKKLKKEILAWTETMKDPKFDPALRERYEQGIRNNQRALEDLELKVRKLVGKTQDDQIISLYKEVKEAIQSYALSHGIQVVMGYGEQIDGDVYSAPNILRKMQGM